MTRSTLGSLLVYGGAAIAAAGAIRSLLPRHPEPRRRRRISECDGPRLSLPSSPPRSFAVSAAQDDEGRWSPSLQIATGLAITAAGFLLPPRTQSIDRVASKLDEAMPEWEFNEVHSMHVDAPPDVVFDAVRNVRANEIALFHTLTWIRRAGRELPESILNARDGEPLLDVATRTGFEWLANDPPRELVVGTCLIGPDRRAYGAVNFLVTPEGRGSRVTTETRVHAKDAGARRRFTVYWRIIYPGSALIRRMWLRAVRERATGGATLSFAE